MVETRGWTRAVETDEGGMPFPIRILTDLTVTLGNRGCVSTPTAGFPRSIPMPGGWSPAGANSRADHAVIAAGAWVNKLTPAPRADRGALAPGGDVSGAAAGTGAALGAGAGADRHGPPQRHLATLPPRRGTRLKIGDHVFTRAGDADGDRIATEADVARLESAARLAYRDFDRYQVLERKICFYTVTRDDS